MAYIEQKQIAFMTSLDFDKWKPEDVAKCLSRLGYGGVEWTLGFFHPRKTTASQRRHLAHFLI